MRSVLAAVVLALVLAAPARAGTYDVWGCSLPNWQPAPITGWSPVSDRATPPVNECGTGRGMRADMSGLPVPYRASTGWAFDAPAGTAIAAYELYRRARSAAAPDHQTAHSYALYHDEPRFDPLVTLFEFCTPSVHGCTGVGDAASPSLADPDNRSARSGLRIRRLILRIQCDGVGQPLDCAGMAVPGSLAIGRARITLEDAAAPVMQPPTGQLVTDGALLDGAQGVTVAAEDVGGGVAGFAVVVDGGTVTEHRLCVEPYVRTVPCPSTARTQFAFDTAAVPNGWHAMQIAAIDAGGNRTLSSPVRVWVGNGATPNGTTPSRSARLTAGFARSRRQPATVGYGETRAVRGRLTDAGGRPIAGARIEVTATARHAGAAARPEGVALTARDGTFRYVVRRGPSRRLAFAYRAYSLDPEPAATAVATLNVRAGVRLVVRPRRTHSRGTIRFRGRLLGGPGRAGVQVTLYAVGRSGRSRVPVAVLRTDAGGRFRFRYRFLRTFAPFTYRFQAAVEHQRGYPYAAAASNVATVRVVRD